MSRFSGWTMKDIARLNGTVIEQPKKAVMKSDSSDYVGMISGALSMLKIDHVREYKFLHDRRFRFDIAIPNEKIAVEFEGGIFKNGRHTRGIGYAKDVKKYNLATMHGWKLLRYTSAEVNKSNWEFKAASEIKELIMNQNNTYLKNIR